MSAAEVIHQVREAAASAAWTVNALEAALRAQPDADIAAALRDALADANSVRRRIQNATKWLTAGAAR